MENKKEMSKETKDALLYELNVQCIETYKIFQQAYELIFDNELKIHDIYEKTNDAKKYEYEHEVLLQNFKKLVKKLEDDKMAFLKENKLPIPKQLEQLAEFEFVPQEQKYGIDEGETNEGNK